MLYQTHPLFIPISSLSPLLVQFFLHLLSISSLSPPLLSSSHLSLPNRLELKWNASKRL
ncbi:hypothetical protein ACFX13_018659 [Malus domestica]